MPGHKSLSACACVCLGRVDVCSLVVWIACGVRAGGCVHVERARAPRRRRRRSDSGPLLGANPLSPTHTPPTHPSHTYVAQVTRAEILDLLASQPEFTPESIDFQAKLLERSGTGQATHWPPSILQIRRPHLALRRDAEGRPVVEGKIDCSMDGARG